MCGERFFDGWEQFFAENKMMCKDHCDSCDLHGNAVAICRLFKTEVHVTLPGIICTVIWLY